MDDRVYPHEQPLPENVVTLDIVTTQDLNPQQILRNAYDAGIADIVVVGMTEDGQEFFESSVSDAAEAMYHLQRAIHKLNNMLDAITRGEVEIGKP